MVGLMKAAALVKILASLNMADVPVVEDMVYVAVPKPFLIDIFEAGDPSRASGKAFRHKDAAESDAYCKKMPGKRLPTEEEWMAAASNLQRNRKYTLRGDQLYTDPGKKTGILANVGGANVV